MILAWRVYISTELITYKPSEHSPLYRCFDYLGILHLLLMSYAIGLSCLMFSTLNSCFNLANRLYNKKFFTSELAFYLCTFCISLHLIKITELE